MRRLVIASLVSALSVLSAANPLLAQQTGEDDTPQIVPMPQDTEYGPVPNYFDLRAVASPPSVEGMSSVRFLMSDDFPPFNYLNADKRLVGFHVELARDLCDQLKISCSVLVRPHAKLVEELKAKTGEAILSGLAIPVGLQEGLAFSEVYLTTPARFVAGKDDTELWPTPQNIKGKSISVLRGTAHEAFLNTFFPDAEIKFFRSNYAARAAMRDGKVDYMFGDGLGLSLWLNGRQSQDCCAFIGGPFTERAFFGQGFAMALPADRPELKLAFDYALRELFKNGKYGELFLRHFPISFF